MLRRNSDGQRLISTFLTKKQISISWIKPPDELHFSLMPRRQPRARSLSIFLIKEELSLHRQILFDIDGLTRHRVSAGDAVIGDLYVKPTVDRTPSWLSMFEGALVPGI